MKSAATAALIHDGRRITYAELSSRIDRLANGLSKLGVGRGDRVAYLGDNEPAFVETFFACGTIGAIFVPLNTRLAAPEVSYQLQDSGSTVLIHSEPLAPIALAAVETAPVDHRIVVEYGGRRSDLILDRGSAYAEVLFEDIIASGEDTHPEVDVQRSDPAFILYTSGTTGRPKGAVLTHDNIAWNCFNAVVDLELGAAEVVLIISPLFHVAALDMGVMPTLMLGGTVVLEQRFEPGRALELIEEHRATYISGVPTTYQLLAEHENWERTDLSSLSKLSCGGSSVPTKILDAYEAKGLSFSQGYGMTETAPGAAQLLPHETRLKAGSVGLPHMFTDVRIVDPEGEIVPAGEIGEIQIIGPNVISEYWNRPEATADSFSHDGWFKSGDMGYFDSDGYLYIADRLKDMIISGGENIYPAEVEQLISDLDGVTGVAVIGVADERWGEVPRAILTLKRGTTLTEEELVAELRGKIAGYKIPRTMRIVDEFPRTGSGKIRKADLRQEFGD